MDSLPNKENESFSLEIHPNGSMNIGAVKNNKFSAIINHIANWNLLKIKSEKNIETFKKFESMIKFCFQNLGKNAIELVNKDVDANFKV